MWRPTLNPGMFMKIGKNELAIENYKKSLELNPENENAKKILDELK